MSYERYLNAVSGNFRKAVKIEWLNPDETVKFEFTNALYDISVDLSVNYQNGSRRSCTITLNNDKNKYPINFNNIWIGQKFKVWMGVYIDEKTPYYFPQGVFYVSNPNEVFQPDQRVIKINGVDKWAFLDGTLYGKLSGTYQTNVGTNLFDATRELLRLPRFPLKHITDNIEEYFVVTNNGIKDQNKNPAFKYENGEFSSTSQLYENSRASITLTAKTDMIINFDYGFIIGAGTNSSDCTVRLVVGNNVVVDPNTNGRSYSSKEAKLDSIYNGRIFKGQKIVLERYESSFGKGVSVSTTMNNIKVDTSLSNIIDPITPFVSPVFYNKADYVKNTNSTRDTAKKYYTYNNETGVYSEYTGTSFNTDYSKLYVKTEFWKCPYTAKVERGKTYADVLLEYATILCAHIYYDANGRLVIEPMIDTADDITDTNKEVVWHYTVEEKTFLGLSQTYNFDKVHNDIMVLGNIVNGYQFKARVQNQNLMSNTCVQKIGLKTKEPIEDNQYYSDEQCKELALYHAKMDTILQKSGNITSIPLFHLDVNKLVTISTPNNHMSKELFLITGYTLNSSETMSIDIISVNILKDFSVVEVDAYA